MDGSIRLSSTTRLDIRQVVRVADGAEVSLEGDTARMLDLRRRQVVDRIRSTGEAAYGFNRGFGHNVDVHVPEDRLEALQHDLLRSHAACVGERAPERVVRAAMLLRAASLARGHSGVRAVVVRRLLDLLNAGLTPVVPQHGSVGASGDLAPLSHIGLTLLGEGSVTVDDGTEPIPAAVALAAAGLEPLALEMKEGLALNNGLQFSTAYGLLACDRLDTLLRTACVATAITTQVQLGSDDAFDADLHALRPHAGAITVARWLRGLLRDSPIRAAHAAHAIDWEVQDPYSIRCAAQVLGTCLDLVAGARTVLETEANSVTDNPLLLSDGDGAFTRIVSGGHFHGMPVAVKLYDLLQAVAIMARLSNMRCARYVDEKRNKGLGRDLIWPGLSDDERATSSGMMIPEYVSAALTNAIWGECMPSHLLSISTDAGQEDVVSMSAGVAIRLWDALPRLAEVLAIELAFGAQAAAVRREADHIPSKRELTPEQRARTEAERRAYAVALRAALGEAPFDIDLQVREQYRWSDEERRLSPVCEAVVDRIRRVFPLVDRDRMMSEQLSALAALVGQGEVLRVAERGAPWTE